MILPDTRLFSLPPGVDFAAELVRGLDARMPGARPEDWADVTIWANTPRMARRIRAVFESGPARVIPRLRLLGAVDAPGLPAAQPPLRRRLDLARLVAALIAARPGIAPREHAFALADSLAALMDEMQGEGVSAEAIAALDVSDQSGHWAQAVDFLRIVQSYTAADAPDAEGRRRQAVLRLSRLWKEAPPAHPVILAGSTGSRGTTALFMQAVARLPLGAVVLPGVDPDMPPAVWEGLSDARAAEDHPQYRFRKLADLLGLSPADIVPWTDAAPPCPARNRLVSLSLRPAPVTECWIDEGPGLGDLAAATAGLTLVEAPSPRIEAEAIALRLRQAVEAGQRAALVSPDRMLTRQVTAALDRWDIRPDDSAGLPLALSPPGRFLRQIAHLRTGPVAAEALVAILKHPLAHTGADRGPHLLAVQDLELRLRRRGPAYPDGAALRSLGDSPWHAWLAGLLDDLPAAGELPLADHVAAHVALAERMAAGSGQADAGQAGAGALWDEAAGRDARAVVDDLLRHADAGGAMTAGDHAALFDDLIAAGQVRDRDAGHPLVRILGPREAREVDADLVILGGLNDGTWPALPAPDPWLNRALRLRAGLLLPERQIGLSAHDYQQAVAAPQVWITRAVKSDQAETVPARWVARLTNLLDGLPAQGGPAALAAMRAEGARWVAAAQALSVPAAPADPEPRPSPAPPAAFRPRRLAVTTVERLLRDPYAVYAQEVLRLRPLDPLTGVPDAAMQGTVLHRVFEVALAGGLDPADPDAARRLMAAAETVMAEDCPWPMTRRQWLARLTRAADWFIAGEAERRARGAPALLEQSGGMTVAETGVELTAKADRLDLSADGRAAIYDYKTGHVPTAKEQAAFSKQLLLTAALVEQGGFAFGPHPVAEAQFIGLGATPQVVAAPLDENPPGKVWEDLAALLRRWAEPGRGYTARMAMLSDRDRSAYDHLSRFGEWDVTAAPVRQVLE